ncbi:Uncharacterised protein [Mycobacteroides abscessus]|nr:Uncharacterised protein [Mycobacteroides abscessus]
MEVADAAARLGDRLAVDLEHEAQHAVRRRVLRTHVDDDALLAERGGRDGALRDLGPVAAGRLEARDAGVEVADGRTGGVRGAAGGAGGVRAHEYDLLVSGGGTVAPLYSTGIPPSG